MKPTPDLPARVVLRADALVRESLDVLDVSVGGLALSSSALRDTARGAQLPITLALGTAHEHTVTVVARWASGDTVGVELVEPKPDVAEALQRYVGELLERGGAS